MKNLRTALGALLLGPLLLSAADAQSGKEIVRKAVEDHKAKDERGDIEMILKVEGKKARKRWLELLFKKGSKGDKYVLRFTKKNPRMKGTALLTHEVKGRADDQWLKVGGFPRLKRVGEDLDPSKRFAETDFTYEDLRTEDLAANTYRKLKDQPVKGTPCFVVEAKPTKQKDSAYSKRLLFVSKKHYLIRMVKLYDRKGRNNKLLAQEDYTKVSGLWRPGKSVMIDRGLKSKTTWTFVERKINKGLSDTPFSPGALKRYQ